MTKAGWILCDHFSPDFLYPFQEEQVSILCFQPDNNVGRQVIVEISGLYERPERTEVVRVELARVVGEFIHKQYLRATVIEVFVQSFNPTSGFWQYHAPDGF